MAANYQPPQWLIPENNNTNKVGNYSLNLDSVGDVISLGDPSLIGNKAALSVSVWFNTKDGTNVQGILGAYAGNLTTPLQKWFGIQIDLNASYTIRVVVANATGNNPYVDFNPVLATDTWYHLVMLYDGGGATNTDKVKAYLNGGLLTSNNDFGTLPTTTYAYASSDWPLYIGARGYAIANPPTTDLFDGEISELSIFDYVLSAANITTLYGDSTNGVGNPMALTSPPIGYWKGDKAGFGDQWALPNQVNYDQAFDFNGTNQWVQVPRSTGIEPATALTCSFWMKATTQTTTYNYLLSKSETNPSYAFYTAATTDKLTFYIYRGAYVIGPAISGVFDDEWHHIVGTWDGERNRIYVDGVLAGTSSLSAGSISYGSGDLYIGDLGTGAQEYEGELSNVTIWDSVLSDPEVLTLYNNGTPITDLTSFPDSANVQGWWKLDQSATWNGSDWSIPDDSTNSNTGTSDGMTQANLVSTTLARSTSDSNYSFNFDGVGDYATTAYSTSAGNKSLSLWFKSSASGYTVLLGDSTSALSLGDSSATWGDESMVFYSSTAGSGSTYIMFAINNGHTAYLDGNWHHAAIVYDGTTKLVYIDGVSQTVSYRADATYTGVASTDINLTNLLIGDSALANTMEGNLSNISFWNSALSQANIITLYNNGRPGDLSSFSPTPTAWWKLGDDAFATAASSTAWTIPDQIGSNDGTSVGNPTISGEAPGSSNNGLSINMNINDRTGESGHSVNNAQSYNMATTTRIAYT